LARETFPHRRRCFQHRLPLHMLSKYSIASARQCFRVVKERDSKSIGLCPQRAEFPRCRSPRFESCFHLAWRFVFRKLRFGPCRQEESIGAIHFAFHCISHRYLIISLQTFTPGQGRAGDLQRARLRWPQDHGCLLKANPASHSCNNLLPLVKSRAASHSEPPNFAFRLQMFAELYGPAPGIGHQGEAAGGGARRKQTLVVQHFRIPQKTSRGEGTAILLTRVGIDNSLFGSRLTSTM
jgi:hypothetical protein